MLGCFEVVVLQSLINCLCVFVDVVKGMLF